MMLAGRCRAAAVAALEYLKDSQYQPDENHPLLRHWQLLAASGVIALSLPMGQACCEASRVCWLVVSPTYTAST